MLAALRMQPFLEAVVIEASIIGNKHSYIMASHSRKLDESALVSLIPGQVSRLKVGKMARLSSLHELQVTATSVLSFHAARYFEGNGHWKDYDFKTFQAFEFSPCSLRYGSPHLPSITFPQFNGRPTLQSCCRVRIVFSSTSFLLQGQIFILTYRCKQVLGNVLQI